MTAAAPPVHENAAPAVFPIRSLKRRTSDSIQAKVIATLMNGDYDMIIDDDGKGEAADVVTITLIGDAAAPSRIDVEFYHCKYSLAAAAGRRIYDLYEVCCQAQKSISWMSSHDKRTDLFTHLLRREARRQETSLRRGIFTRQGANASLEEIAKQSGVGAGTLYRHFPTRDELIEGVYRNEVEKLAAADARFHARPVEMNAR